MESLSIHEESYYYLLLLSARDTSKRIAVQGILARLRDKIAELRGTDSETVQDEFELKVINALN
jgi:hypothetical protein